MMMEGSVIQCRHCKNVCRLVLPGIVTVEDETKGILGTYNLWQCDECGGLFRELAGHKRIKDNRIVDCKDFH